jgi:hypothetical protein
MGRFRKDVPAVDPELDGAIIYETPRLRDVTRRFLAKSQPAICSSLAPDEVPISIVGHRGSWGNLLVVTNHRLMNFKGMNLAQEFPHADIAEARVISTPAGKFVVAVNTAASKMYPASDKRRYFPEIFISVTFDDPKYAHRLCAIINAAR